MTNKIYIGKIYEEIAEDLPHGPGAIEEAQLLIALYIKRNIDSTIPKDIMTWMDNDTTKPFIHNNTEYAWGFPD